MKQTTIVNGVTLTREQVEAALNDLNTPEFQPGDLVRTTVSKRICVVLGGPINKALSEQYGTPLDGYLRVTDGCETIQKRPCDLTRVVTSL